MYGVFLSVVSSEALKLEREERLYFTGHFIIKVRRFIFRLTEKGLTYYDELYAIIM